MKAPPPALILDTTLRDGEQAPGVALTPDEKADYVRLAECTGIRYLEVGFPQNTFDRLACQAAVAASTCARLVAMALTTKESVDAAVEAGVHEVLLVVPSSTQHIQWLYGRSLDDLLNSLTSSVRHAANRGLAVNIGLEDASQNDMEVLEKILTCLRTLGELVDCVTVPDTRGQLLPHDVGKLILWVRNRLNLPHCRLAFHAHDDLGLATANSLQVLQLSPPVQCVHATVGGFGERAGNASLEQMVMLCETKLRLATGIDPKGLVKLAEFVQSAFLTMISPHAPIVGRKTVLHESGLHQRAIIQNPRAYSAVDTDTLDLPVQLVLGKHSSKPFFRELARRSGASEEQILALQKAIVAANKTVLKAQFDSMVGAFQKNAFIGLLEEDAVGRLTSRGQLIHRDGFDVD